MFREIGKMLGDLQIENDKLKLTITAIKEFVENETAQNCDTNIILQKINEVENEGN